jgi:hypothetical protein
VRTPSLIILCIIISFAFCPFFAGSANAQTPNPELYTVKLTATTGTIHVGDSLIVHIQVYYDGVPLTGNASNYVSKAQFSSSDDSVVSFGTQPYLLVDVDGSGMASVTATGNKAGTATLEALVPVAIPMGRSEDGPYMLDGSVTVTILPPATPTPAPMPAATLKPTPTTAPSQSPTDNMAPVAVQQPVPARIIQAPGVQSTPSPTEPPVLTPAYQTIDVEPASTPEPSPNTTAILTADPPQANTSNVTQQPQSPPGTTPAPRDSGGFYDGMVIVGGGVIGALTILIVVVLIGSSMKRGK